MIRGEADALAYALTRTPATYAATRRVLSEVLALRPDAAPDRLLDVGSGPGGAGWAALDALPELASVIRLDHSPAFLDLAQDLAAAGPPVLAGAGRFRADLTDAAVTLPEADLVLAAYTLTEIALKDLTGVAQRLWTATADLLVIIEPGSPEGWRRGLAIRALLIDAGARLVGPCAHISSCPLAEPDWCHFAQRLPRSRAHRLAKGGTAPFEDEKFFWLAFDRGQARPGGQGPARIIAPPRAGKAGVSFRVCRADGTAGLEEVLRRNRPHFNRTRRLGWGSAFDPEEA